MADKIDIEIALEGGQEVEKQLADIGKAGQQAFGDIQNAADQIDLSQATDALKNAQAAVQGAATFEKVVQGIGKVEGAFDSLGNAASKMASRLTRSLGPLGVFARALGPIGIALGVLGGAFVKFGDDAADGINTLVAAGAKLSLMPQQFDQLQKSLARLGISSDAIGPGLDKLKEKLSTDFFPTNIITGLGRAIEQLERLPDSVQRTQLAIATFGEAFGSQLIAGLNAGTISIQQLREAFASVTPVTQQQIVDAARYQQAINQLSAAWTELKGSIAPITTPIFQFLTEQVNIFRQNLQQLWLELNFAKGVWDIFKAAITGQNVGEAARKAAEEYKKLEQQLKQSGAAATQSNAAVGQAVETTTQKVREYTVASTDAADATSDVTVSVIDLNANATASASGILFVTQAMQGLFQGMQSVVVAGGMFEGLIVSINNLGRAFAFAAAEAASLANMVRYLSNIPRPTSIPLLSESRPNPIGFADGGLLGGRGTGTSDSNLAWVSRGEHIMPARAVGQPGVLAFLEALRRSGGNLRGVLDGLGRFALGGLVPRSLPAFAAGGPVGGMSHVTIQFPGLPPVGGLRASSAVVEELQRSAALAQVRSGGRKPSRYS